MNKIKAWLEISRPKTLFAGVSPVILSLGLISTQTSINFSIAAITLICVLFLQIGTNIVNDYYDISSGIDSPDRLGPLRSLHKGELRHDEVKRGFVACFLFAFLFGIILMLKGGIPIILIGLISILCAYLYTGGPFPFSRYGLGEVVAFIFFGPIAVWGTAYLQVASTNINHFNYIFYGFGVGFISSAIMLTNNIRDQESDQKSNKKTLVTLFGNQFSRNLFLLFILLSSLWPLYLSLSFKLPTLSLASLIGLFFYKNWLKVYQNPPSQEFNQYLAKTGQYLFIQSLFTLVLCSL